MPFDQYAAAGFATEILPLLPHDAALSPASKLDPADLGKIPGKKTGRGWVGFGDWSNYVAQQGDAERWTKWGAGVALQGRNHPAIDVDIDEEELADVVEREASHTLGKAPCRFGRGPRRLLCFAAGGLRKRRLVLRRRVQHREGSADAGRSGPAGVFREPAAGGALVDQGPPDGGGLDRQPPEPVAADYTTFAVELLATGQQYAVETIHPKTRRPYWWRDGVCPADIGADKLTQVTAEQVDAFFENIKRLLVELYDCEVVSDTGTARPAPESTGSGRGGLLAPSIEAVKAALAAVPNETDHDEWLKVCAYVKGATGGSEEGFELFDEWSATWEGGADPGDARAKWDSVRPPWKTGWPQLARWASEASNGRFSGAVFEFEAVGDALPGQNTEGDIFGPDPIDQMLKDYVWVRNPGCAVELATRDFLTREPFNVELKHIGAPHEAKKCAWAVFNNHPGQVRARGVTYMPFGKDILETDGGALVNLWRAPALRRFGQGVDDAAVEPWLALVRHLVPDRREREILLDWMAWVVQHQDRKPGWAVLMKSRVHGVGKGFLVRPLKYAVGRENTYEVREDDLSSPYTHWANRKKLVIVEEIAGLERKAMMQKLKSYLSSPPETITINEKNIRQFVLPNLFAAIFFTNKPDALQIEATDRRFFVIDADVPKREAAFYGQLKDWLDADGEALVAQWLSERNVAAFGETAVYEAPGTDAKETARRAALSLLDEWVLSSIEDEAAPFDVDLVAAADIQRQVPKAMYSRGVAPTIQRITNAMYEAGCRPLGKLRLGKPLPSTGTDRVALMSVRRHEMLAGCTPEKLRDLFWEMRDKAETGRLRGEFG